ncbi:NAD(P)/FAD-dependent oxidoreductase [Promicromonospora iranensis]|uniref:Flavin-dependent dehydrogenase n=1 Tax=Promicromonospora iranensis TaxID=1105144 RepID=A0ABU2CUN1_9MICO|nr:flavin-dependent dehydrogenase [Promicromonospora iranensis]
MGSGTTDVDVLVVGAGPVGLAAAVRARAAGLDVLVVDRRSGTLDKACGEGLLPGALRAVQALGIDPPGHQLSGISYRSPGRCADHRFTSGPGRGVRRTTLHDALRERATDVGAPFLHGRVCGLRQDAAGVEVDVARTSRADGAGEARGSVTVRAGWVLGCDGLHSTVRRLAGLEPGSGQHGGRPTGDRYGLRRHFQVRPWTDLVEVHWSPDVEAYVTPVGAETVGVALLGSRTVHEAGFDALLRSRFPELSARLAGAAVTGSLLGAGPLRRRSRRRSAGRVRLVGDASGYVDALTGEGVRVGLAQADAAVRHLGDGDAYERAWRAVTRDYRTLTTGLLAWASSPVRRAIVPAASRAPWLYGAVVERLAR